MKQKSIDWKRVGFIFLVVLGTLLVFTFFDYLVHQLSNEYAVPSYYFRNKIIFGTIIGFIGYWFVKKLSPFKKALGFSLIIAILLQIRYYLEGYSKEFVFEFLGIHFVILVVVSWLAFKYILNKKQ